MAAKNDKRPACFGTHEKKVYKSIYDWHECSKCPVEAECRTKPSGKMPSAADVILAAEKEVHDALHGVPTDEIERKFARGEVANVFIEYKRELERQVDRLVPENDILRRENEKLKMDLDGMKSERQELMNTHEECKTLAEVVYEIQQDHAKAERLDAVLKSWQDLTNSGASHESSLETIGTALFPSRTTSKKDDE